ncbi:hypothetical protein EAF00_003086 [Botryotinia globosa]|nr:hypothetical protein EAF00_003086 [Botryotinia globosa]
MAPKSVQGAHDSLGQEYPELLVGKIQRGTALMQRAIATFHDDLKSFAVTKALESAKSSDGGVKKLLAAQKIPGLTLVDTDKIPGFTLVDIDKNQGLALVDSDKNLDPALALVDVETNPALTPVNVDKIPEPTESPVRYFYHENGRGLNGAYLDPHLRIFLFACTETPKVQIEDQVEMKGRWLKFPWKLFCGNFPVILKFLNENYHSMKEGAETLVYDPYTTATPKLSYRGVGFNFMFFMESDFAKKQSGYDDVEYFTAYKAFKTLRSLGLSLKQLKGVDENMSFSEREEMIAMARFLGMSEESIEEKVMASKDVFVKKVAQEGSEFIAFDDPIESEAVEGQVITVPSKKDPENKLAGMASKFSHFKHLDRKRKFEE